MDTAPSCYIPWILSGPWRTKNPVSENNLVWIIFLITTPQIYYNTISASFKFGPQISFIISTRKQKINSSHRRLFAAERLFYLFWLIIYPCQSCIKRKFEYIFFSDTDEYKKYYFHRRYCDLIFFLTEINRINADHAKLDKKILKTETKIFRFYCQYKLLLYYLRELDDRETRNIENIQKTEKKIEFCRNIDPDLSVSDNLFFTVSKTNRVLAAISDK